MFLPGSHIETAQVVVNCYDFFDRVFPESGRLDLTEGMYCGDPSIPYEQAQKKQINWLLDDRTVYLAQTFLIYDSSSTPGSASVFMSIHC